ncbi:hypothetical protein PFDSM3638_04950 [Pyrococcus furiosus DSM 3638]|uniref:Uncharacterized protein n=3 Tax=Pyrococcus furiosus TaxID=2261 RepID=A0A5C0XP92_PYRFU|nr:MULTISPECIES: hypothetical protein [Pyrococcus]AAL81108.1 hypothetical protein PF0984 [Pyrococcus furiosus DSM 3638]AFN03779.1 hypothetical protein PFC_04150 [Pyrococcus furiosus COM1]MDK2869837.1 hypothetical protein [Pyrococcus sp.]QEK78649.1 hypothetical protein PFDSM3638_04950 [Pyrococcus furiosus DSM 3638]
MEELRIKVLTRLAEKALKELEEAYKRIPDTDNGKTYLLRGKERVRLMLNILKEVERDAI